MNKKELEKKLQESADNIKLRNFDDVWAEIKDRLVDAPPEEEPKKKFAFSFKKWVPVILSFCLILSVAIGLPIYLNNLPDEPNGIIYYQDQLTYTIVQENDFYSKLTGSDIESVPFNEYTCSDFTVYLSVDNKMVGGQLSITLLVENNPFMASTKFYHKSVQLNETNVVYNQTFTTNGAQIEYVQTSADSGIYIYAVKANYKSVNYFIELTCMTDNIQPFLTEFFS